ncbi:MAG: protein-L-isoaspartate(D-aspartate) O-methyltransferase [Candidatus Omnitrophota bacterium]|jgi:protein-L-isoaspartate(D-aspartate) O-methyltransferase|nr:MAG: protein-L-isoaspartate(D-aspartate) O-methyltransferase [Candidatus Omnitrophota bacterium]
MDYTNQLETMLKQQIMARGITHPRVLDAMYQTPRHLFVPDDLKSEAYLDQPLSLPENQATISQPYIVAYMTEALQCQSLDRVLEIGTGSGYQAAILANICKEVYTLERYYTLSLNAQRTILSIGNHNVFFRVDDSLEGWKTKSPFDRIIVTAAAYTAPQTLIDQLKDGGTMLIPLGDSRIQTLTRIRKKGDKIQTENLIPCVFVPLIHHSNHSLKSGSSESIAVE